uniref:Selenoprotein M n=1 Tax=Seriola lalandi dorsalis TaxID=1841481 RepID=A0A3B4YFW3_SERLL
IAYIISPPPPPSSPLAQLPTSLCRYWIFLFSILFIHRLVSVPLLDSHYFSHNLVMKHIPGADPELVLLNHYFEELDRIALSDMTRSEINELLEKLGFYKKAQPEDEVPEEFRFSPAKDMPEEVSDGATQRWKDRGLWLSEYKSLL